MRPTLKPAAFALRRHTPRFAPPRAHFRASMSHPPAPRFAPIARRDLDAPLDFRVDPHVDYDRSLTPEGGISIVFKDRDASFWQMVWYLFLWACPTGLAAWYFLGHAPFASQATSITCVLIVAGLSGFIVGFPSGIYHSIEIRPDCMILDCEAVFWLHFMEAGWPALQPQPDGSFTLCGIYGTRFVEYVSLRRADEQDRTPEVFAAHLQDAMQQLWLRPR